MSKIHLCAVCGWQICTDDLCCASCQAATLGRAPRRVVHVPVLSRAALLIAGVTASVAIGGCAEDGGPEIVREEEVDDEPVAIRPRLTWQLRLSPHDLTGDE